MNARVVAAAPLYINYISHVPHANTIFKVNTRGLNGRPGGGASC
jgi:hypothetical protein